MAEDRQKLQNRKTTSEKTTDTDDSRGIWTRK